MSLHPGDIIDGKYEIVRLLGEGGMGAVYEGLNVRIHRRVAIKVLHGTVAQNAEAIERFEREAQAAGRIGSSHIVEVLDLGDLPAGDRYMVMEFLDGQSLADRVQVAGKLEPRDVYPIAVQLLEGLSAAHAAGIVHRDLKPDNVYLVNSKRAGEQDFVKILDFGISKFNTLGGEFSMTRTGAVMGTPYYMSPEQAKGARELDLRADLYAVGVILYECTSGRVPFQAQTFNELLFKIVLEDPPPLRELQTELDEGFVAIVAKAMARDVSVRYQTAAEIQQALHSWALGAGITEHAVAGHTLPLGAARPVPPAAAALAAASPETPATTPTPAPGAATAPGWSNTHGDASSARRRAPWLIAALVALVALVGLGTFALRGDDAAAAAARAEEEQREVELAKAEQMAVEARAQAEEATRAAELAVSGAQQAAALAEERAQAEAAARTAEREAAEREAAEKAKAAAAPAPKRPAPKKTTQAAATEPAPPQPSPPSKSTTSTGRAIRSTL